MGLNLSLLERRLDKLTGPSPVTKPVLIVGFGLDRSPITHATCRGTRYVPTDREAEPDLIARISTDHPATMESGLVIFIYRDNV